MNCKNCGTPIGMQQGICPNCGTPVENGNIPNVNGTPNMNNIPNMNVNPNVNNGTNMNVNPNVNNVPNMNPSVPNLGNTNFNVPSAMNDSGFVNVQEPSNVNLASGMPNINQPVPDTNTFGADTNSNMNMQQVNDPNNQGNDGMYFGNLQLPDDNKKNKFPWFIVAGVLVVIMIVGVFVLPKFNKINLSTYEGDQYILQYNANWKVDEEKDNMTLYYSDNNSKFIFNALSTFKALNSSVDSEASKKDLYNQFYNAWSDLDGGELTGGTETFLTLNEETLYARVDYAITGQSGVGSFYVIVSEKNDKVISFMTYCTTANKDEIDEDVLAMLDSLTYKKESESSIYDKFKAGEVKEYSAIGYMTYDVPECWTLDEARTKMMSYKSYIFSFLDETSLLDIKAVTPYNSSTGTIGTSYESMKATIVNSYGAVKEEKTKTINGKVWYIIVTPDYTAGDVSYHNEIYFTMSATNQHLYYVEAYISNDTSAKKTKYINDSIEYIISSAELYKINE